MPPLISYYHWCLPVDYEGATKTKWFELLTCVCLICDEVHNGAGLAALG